MDTPSQEPDRPGQANDTSSPSQIDFAAVIRSRFPNLSKGAPQDELDALAEKQLAKERAARLASLAGTLGARYSREVVDAFRIYHPKQEAVWQRVKGLGERIGAVVKNGQDVLFFGSVGTGKDHLLAHLLYRAVDDGFSVRFISGQEFYGRLRGTMDAEANESELAVLQELTSPDVLAISDPIPPVGELTAWRREVLFRLIDRRYRARKCVWLTANVRSSGEADQALSEPVWDRLQHGAEVLLCEWPSFRELKS